MSFYIFFALALGAISAVTDAPMVRPAVENVVRAYGERSETRAARGVVFAARRIRDRRATALFASALPRRCSWALSGASTPRAPGRTC